jgi:hypothetical protein
MRTAALVAVALAGWLLPASPARAQRYYSSAPYPTVDSTYFNRDHWVNGEFQRGQVAVTRMGRGPNHDLPSGIYPNRNVATTSFGRRGGGGGSGSGGHKGGFHSPFATATPGVSSGSAISNFNIPSPTYIAPLASPSASHAGVMARHR